MAENPDVTGDFAAFNTLTLAGIPVTPGGSTPTVCIVSATLNIADSTLVSPSNWANVLNTNTAALVRNPGLGILVLQAGIYHCTANVSWQGQTPAAGMREMNLTVNGTSVAAFIVPQLNQGSNGNITRTPCNLTWTQQFNVNDQISIAVYQNSGNINPIIEQLQVWA